MSPSGPPALLLVSGSGRSGTSTVTGVLRLLGMHVPQPEVPPDESNPRGFFEPQWVVDFHDRLLRSVNVKPFDARPDAWDVVRRATEDPQRRRELSVWLAEQLRHGRVVVKDPRTFWVQDMWASLAEGLGASTSSLTMLRHPAEVAGSRDRHYLQGADPGLRLARETGNVAGWVNVMLTQEVHTRLRPRAFVRYTELVADWRAAVARARDQLDLELPDLGGPAGEQVDDFVDVGLHRSQLTWADLDVPTALRDVAESVWTAVGVLVERPDDPEAMASLDGLRADYEQLHRHAVALAQDHRAAAVAEARAQARRRVTREVEQRLADRAPLRRLGRRLRRSRG